MCGGKGGGGRGTVTKAVRVKRRDAETRVCRQRDSGDEDVGEGGGGRRREGEGGGGNKDDGRGTWYGWMHI